METKREKILWKKHLCFPTTDNIIFGNNTKILKYMVMPAPKLPGASGTWVTTQKIYKYKLMAGLKSLYRCGTCV